MRGSRAMWLVLTAAAAFVATAAEAQRDWSTVEVKSEKVAEGVYMLTGAGGNIGVCVGPDGVFLIDDQYAQLTDKIRAAVAAITDKPIRFVFNTHFHGDHTGGNENLGKAGFLIIAHDNVRRRLGTEQFNAFFNRTTPASPKEALPVVTFNDSVSFHLNGQTIVAVHVPPAHTDGDAVVTFKEADVVHMGDCFFNGIYPVIDVSAGGSAEGIVRAIDKVLPRIGDQTKVIPGHGPLGDKAALKAFRDMLVAANDKIRPLVKAGKTIDQIIAAKPTAELDAKWGGGFIKPDLFVREVYSGMTGKISPPPPPPAQAGSGGTAK